MTQKTRADIWLHLLLVAWPWACDTISSLSFSSVIMTRTSTDEKRHRNT